MERGEWEMKIIDTHMLIDQFHAAHSLYMPLAPSRSAQLAGGERGGLSYRVGID